MIEIINNPSEIVATNGEFCAAGTDLYARRRLGISSGKVTDISKIEGLDQITWNEDGSATIGAMVKIHTIAKDKKIQEKYPTLAKAADGLATPQIRHMATIGGNLLQRNRCWYYRNPAFSCYKNGGNSCPARIGNHHYGVAFDTSDCVAVHPSTLGMALTAYAAQFSVEGRAKMTINDLYGNGKTPRWDHQLTNGELLTKIHLPKPIEGEKGAYFRTITRHEAEWALVECVASLSIENGKIAQAKVAIGAVANIPMALSKVNHFLEGQAPTESTFMQAAKIATLGANPLPMTTYKVSLIYGTVLETLLRVVDLAK